MKIVRVEASRYMSELDLTDFGSGAEMLVVEIETDDGIVGTGYVSLFVEPSGSLGFAYAALINNNFRAMLIGEDATANEKLWDTMFRASIRWGRRGIPLQCISAIDIALWDIKAKIAGMPLWQLLGGPVRDTIPTYANTAVHLPPDEIADLASKYVSMGFKAVKIRGSATAVSTEEATARVQAVREAIGSDIKLMVDVNGTWDVDTATRMLRLWEPYDLYWLEEPVQPDDIAGYRQVRAVANSVAVNIAGGEQHGTLYEFQTLFERGAVDIAQPDCSIVGGITEFLMVAHLAQAHSIRVSPHTLQHVHNHLVAALPNVMWVEFFMDENPLRAFERQLLYRPIEALEARSGVLDLPSAPGLGIELDPEVVERCKVTEG